MVGEIPARARQARARGHSGLSWCLFSHRCLLRGPASATHAPWDGKGYIRCQEPVTPLMGTRGTWGEGCACAFYVLLTRPLAPACGGAGLPVRQSQEPPFSGPTQLQNGKSPLPKPRLLDGRSLRRQLYRPEAEDIGQVHWAPWRPKDAASPRTTGLHCKLSARLSRLSL